MQNALDPEKDQIIRIAEGDEQAFYQLYKTYAPKLRSYVLRSTRSNEDTEEILQAVFIRIWLSRDKLPGIDNVPAWIYTIAARICLQHFRKKKNDQKKLDRYNELQSEHNSTPDELAQLSGIRRMVDDVIGRMPAQRKNIYRLNREQGYKPAEIAEKLSMPVGTVKNHLSAASRDIREALTAAGYGGFILVGAILHIF